MEVAAADTLAYFKVESKNASVSVVVVKLVAVKQLAVAAFPLVFKSRLVQA